MKSKETMQEKEGIKKRSDELVLEIASLTNKIDSIIGKLSTENQPLDENNQEEDEDVESINSEGFELLNIQSD